MSDTITPFRISATDAELEDLKRRLANARFPDRETPDDWSQGIPLAYVKELRDYWLHQYDWRERERRLNRFPQFRTTVDGLGIHFIHLRSTHEKALPLLITHGWPGSIVEFHKVIEPLVQPELHGGRAEDAFHVVAPSLPGYGFSDKPTEPGWGVEKIARTWDQLMLRLGYDRYVAQGGDWGSIITNHIGAQNLGHCIAIHLNMPIAPPDPATMNDLTQEEKDALASMQYYRDHDSGYSKEQSTRPQTVGYGLADSPVGQAAWIIEKYHRWMDCDGHPENILSKDELLDNVMMYWLSDSAASSARLYWESFGSGAAPATVSMPTGCSIFPKEIFRTSRRWAEKIYTNLIHFRTLPKGGHFAAFEQPATFITEVRDCFRQCR